MKANATTRPTTKAPSVLSAWQRLPLPTLPERPWDPDEVDEDDDP